MNGKVFFTNWDRKLVIKNRGFLFSFTTVSEILFLKNSSENYRVKRMHYYQFGSHAVSEILKCAHWLHFYVSGSPKLGLSLTKTKEPLKKIE